MSKFYGREEYESLLFDEEGSAEEMWETDPVFEEDLPEAEDLFDIEEPSEGSFRPLILDLVLEDGSTRSFEAAGVFICGEQQYMALHPAGEENAVIHLMRCEEGEDDELKLLEIEDDQEFEAATEAFYRLLDDDHPESEWYDEEEERMV